MTWRPMEDLILLNAVKQLGSQWDRIAGMLPGRSAHAARNRFYRLQQQQQQELGGLGPA